MRSKNKTTITVEPGKQELFITREFEAPPALVFKAYTDPHVLVQWLGPRDLTTRVEKFEPVSGGAYRYVSVDPQGNEFGFHGTFHEMSPTLMIQTFEFEGLPEPGHVSLDTLRLEALPGNRTRIHIQSVFQSVADRDGMAQSGMEQGLTEGYERLDDILATWTK